MKAYVESTKTPLREVNGIWIRTGGEKVRVCRKAKCFSLYPSPTPTSLGSWQNFTKFQLVAVLIRKEIVTISETQG